ncbi:hypothetical protein HanXRQr2_Chr10g0449951 [Helianthus annuus]|uniref:Uncharacterized protein n=1 Tax=Helianthus annuus TaxID=4232 RepID=A0A9K3HZQ0_HELAN|nr:hypothetical protein HanXRQr2_Chr10g0449951 [Helianthus annuus]
MIIFNQSRADPNTAKSFDKQEYHVILPSSKLNYPSSIATAAFSCVTSMFSTALSPAFSSSISISETFRCSISVSIPAVGSFTGTTGSSVLAS